MKKGISVTKEELDAVEDKVFGNKKGFVAFKQSLEVGQVITEDLLVVIGAVHGLLHSGLTRHALCVLVQAAAGKGPGGRPKYSIDEVSDMLDVLASLNQFIEVKK